MRVKLSLPALPALFAASARLPFALPSIASAFSHSAENHGVHHLIFLAFLFSDVALAIVQLTGLPQGLHSDYS